MSMKNVPVCIVSADRNDWSRVFVFKRWSASRCWRPEKKTILVRQAQLHRSKVA
jgi:hypothetical protein